MPVLGEPVWEISQGDTRDYLRVPLKGSDGSVPNLVGATVTFVLVHGQQTVISYLPAFIIDIPTGVVEYRFTAAQTATKGKNYGGKFRVTYADGTTQSFPTDTYIPVWIE